MTRLTQQLARGKPRVHRLVALVLYMLTVMGMPLPVPVMKDASQPFPCARRACGCMNAAACARACCCHSRAERVAWHRERGFRVPTELTDQVAATDTVAGGAAPATRPTRPCCAKRHAPAQTPVAPLKGLSVVEAAQCRGQVAAGPAAVPAIVPPAAPLPAPRRDLPRWTLPLDECLVTWADRPDLPPPRG